MTRVVALVACAALASGCFGYSPSAKKWSYVGNTVLIVGGGGAIAADLLTHEPCEGVNCSFDPPFGGPTVAGALLVSAGIIGIILTATRDEVKTSR
jgi:hypothetical protein